MESRMSKLRRTLLPYVLSGLISLVACELLLRAFTTSHYEIVLLADGTKVLVPCAGTRLFGTAGLYEGAGSVEVRVTDQRFIHPGYEQKGETTAIFLGGSTTRAGDPGIGIFILPLGVLLLLVALVTTAWAVTASNGRRPRRSTKPPEVERDPGE